MDRHVGNAMPFDTCFPLKILPHSLQNQNNHYSTRTRRHEASELQLGRSHVSIMSSPRFAISTNLVPTLHAALTAAITPAQQLRVVSRRAPRWPDPLVYYVLSSEVWHTSASCYTTIECANSSGKSARLQISAAVLYFVTTVSCTSRRAFLKS
jgi:hypothetical protein